MYVYMLQNSIANLLVNYMQMTCTVEPLLKDTPELRTPP